MMRKFTADELERMRDTQDAAMQDLAWVLRYSSMTDGYGLPEGVYARAFEVVCGLELVDPAEMQGTGEVPVIDARLRLPIETVVDERDRIEVTERYGEVLGTSQVFEIEGPVERGPSGLVLKLRTVDDA